MRLQQILPWKLAPPGVSNPASGDLFTIDPGYITAPMPKVLWIELTSKCPFDCVFCTRKIRFGPGRNLDFTIYQKLIAELDSPDFIGLNYSGESLYYPQLLEAIKLAKSTGALIELVTAFSTVSKRLLQGIVESGLDRLAVSLHTMNPEQYRTLYGLGSLDLLKQRIDDFLEMKAALGVQKPRLDFCFVAMKENVHELSRVVEYAKSVGVAEISVHPIIGRHLVPHDFSHELQGNKLRDGFKETLRNTVAQVKAAHPDFAVNVLNADLDVHPRLTHRPAYFAPSLPAEGKIFGCDQSPFESAHILATGKVVVCEVLDEVPLGDLHQQSLRDIWQGEAYQRFRRDYLSNASPECRSCVWKIAYIPDRWASLIDLRDGMNAQLLRGWHTYEESGIIWSRKGSLLALRNPKGHKRIRIAGILPHAVAGQNTLAITCNGTAAGEVQNGSSAFLSFDKTISVPSSSPVFHIGFLTAHVFRPSLHGAGIDSRDLGFALQRIEVC